MKIFLKNDRKKIAQSPSAPIVDTKLAERAVLALSDLLRLKTRQNKGFNWPLGAEGPCTVHGGSRYRACMGVHALGMRGVHALGVWGRVQALGCRGSTHRACMGVHTPGVHGESTCVGCTHQAWRVHAPCMRGGCMHWACVGVHAPGMCGGPCTGHAWGGPCTRCAGGCTHQACVGGSHTRHAWGVHAQCAHGVVTPIN